MAWTDSRRGKKWAAKFHQTGSGLAFKKLTHVFFCTTGRTGVDAEGLRELPKSQFNRGIFQFNRLIFQFNF